MEGNCAFCECFSEDLAIIHNRKLCSECADKEIEKEEIFKLPSKQLATEYTNEKKEVIARLAGKITEKYNIITIRETEPKPLMYYWDRGVYCLGVEGIIRQEGRRYFGSLANSYDLNELTNYIRTSNYISEREFVSDPNKLSVQNGIVNLKTGKLEWHYPKFYTTTQLPITYDPKADCPKFKKFVSEIVAPEDIPLMQEIVGYSLLPSYPFHKAFMLHGSGRNGKSTFLSVMGELVGNNNTTNHTLQQLVGNRFAVGTLKGKLLNISPDLPSQALRDTALFKALSGNDWVTGEHKFGSLFSFRNYAKLLFSANKLPKVDDDTYAYWSRWIIIGFPRNFREEGIENPHLLEELTTPEELSGLFNWGLEGLKRLLEQGKFSNEQSVEIVREQYLLNSDTITAFAESELKFDGDTEISKAEMYSAYGEFCKERGLTLETSNKFSRELPKAVPKIIDCFGKFEGRRAKAWRGYCFKDRKSGELIEKEVNLGDWNE